MQISVQLDASLVRGSVKATIGEVNSETASTVLLLSLIVGTAE